MWYASPGNQGWGSKPASRKPSIMEADLGTLSTTSGSIKRSAGRVIRIINNLDHSVQVSPESSVLTGGRAKGWGMEGGWSFSTSSISHLLFRAAHVINNAQKYFLVVVSELRGGLSGKIAPRALHFPNDCGIFAMFAISFVFVPGQRCVVQMF